MTIATYADLCAAVAGWLKRTDLDAQIPDFIRLAEVRMKSLASPNMWDVTADLVTVPSSPLVALPADFKSPITLWIADINPQQELNQLLVQELPQTITPSRPLYWGIDGASLRFQAPADAAYPIKLRYSRMAALSDSEPTNYILTSYPDVYLFGALSEAADYTFNDQAAAKWGAKFLDAIERMKSAEASNNKNVPLVTELSRAVNRRFNILRGY